MTVRTSTGVSRRDFLLALAAACLVGARERMTVVPLEDACVRRMAEWVG